MIVPYRQEWHITPAAHSLALANTVSTGGSWSTDSGVIGTQKRFAAAGLQGIGCGCGCGGGQPAGGGLQALLCVAALAAAWFLWRRREQFEEYE